MEAQYAASVQPRMVLVGDPGTGKSSFVRHLTLCMAGQQLLDLKREVRQVRANIAALVDWLEDCYTPLYIELRDLVKHAFPVLPDLAYHPATAPTLDDFWNYVNDQILLPHRLESYLPELFMRMSRGEVLIMLDGLDEVSNASDARRRTQMKALVKKLGQYNARTKLASLILRWKRFQEVLKQRRCFLLCWRRFGCAVRRPIHCRQPSRSFMRAV
jgi:hypothetical protein